MWSEFAFPANQHLERKIKKKNPQTFAHLMNFSVCAIDPMKKGMSLFLSYTSMNKMNSLHHVKEHPKISNFLQFES